MTFDYRDPVPFQVLCMAFVLPWALFIRILESATPDA